MSDFGFLNSLSLWLMVPAVLLCELLLQSRERAILALHRTINRPMLSPRRWWRVLLPLTILALSMLALSRPWHGKETKTIQAAGRDLFLLIDVSLSMLAQDTSPSRMDFVRRKAQDILSFLQKHSPEDRLGIILFAGDAYVYCPLTPDYGVVSEFLQHIDPELISSRGSSLLRALTVARDTLKETKGVHPALIVISDGEDLESERVDVERLTAEIDAEMLFLGVGS